MKNYSRTMISMMLVLIAVFISFICATDSFRKSSSDKIMLNDLKKSISENWDNISSFDSSRFGTEMIIFNNQGFRVYSSAGSGMEKISSPDEAADMGYLTIYITNGNRFYGTAVIPDPGKVGYDVLRKKLITANVVIMSIFLTIAVLYGLYVKRTIIKPFNEMEDFAHHVALGNLDTPITLQKNNIFGAFTESFDIMREELRRSRESEEKLKKKEKELIASLSHDLKTPITGIKLLCELLTLKVKDEYISGKIDNINQKAEQINILVSDLLASSLEELGQMTVNCHDERSDLLHELVSLNDTRSLTVESDIPECMINVDKVRLSQVISNIISNSYKYAGTKIDVNYCIRNTALEMSLRDYGPGVPEDEIGLITNKYYRSKSSSVGKDGSGLGLYIASILMNKMNGDLICSNRDKGLDITLYIPLS